MLYVARGLTEVLLNGQNITNELSGQEGLGNTGFFDVFASRPLGLPISRLGDDPLRHHRSPSC